LAFINISSKKTAGGLLLLLDKQEQQRNQTTEGFLGGKISENETWEYDNNNGEKRNSEIRLETRNKKRKLENEEMAGKRSKLNNNDDNMENETTENFYLLKRKLLEEFGADGLEMLKNGKEDENDGHDNDNHSNNNNNSINHQEGMNEEFDVETGTEEEDTSMGTKLGDLGEEEELGELDAGSSTEADDRSLVDGDAKEGAKNDGRTMEGNDDTESDKKRRVWGINEWEKEEGGVVSEEERQRKSDEIMGEEDEDEWEDVIEEIDGNKKVGMKIINGCEFRWLCLKNGRIFNGMGGRKRRPDWKERWIYSYHGGVGSKWEYNKKWGWEDWSRYREKWWWRDDDWEDFVEEEEEEWTEEEEREYLEKEEEYRREAEERWERIDREYENRKKADERNDKVEGEDEGWVEEEDNNCIMDEGKKKWMNHVNGYKYNGVIWDNNGNDNDNGKRGNDDDINNNNHNNIGIVGFKEEEDGWWEGGCRYYYGNGNNNEMRRRDGWKGLRIWAREYIPKKLREEMERLAIEDEIMEIEEAISMEELKGVRKARGEAKKARVKDLRLEKKYEIRMMGEEDTRSRSLENKRRIEEKTRLPSGRSKAGRPGGKVLRDEGAGGGTTAKSEVAEGRRRKRKRRSCITKQPSLWTEMGADEVERRRMLAAKAQHRRGCGATGAQDKRECRNQREINKNYQVRVMGWKERVMDREERNNGNYNWEFEMDFNVEGGLNPVYRKERRREGELDGNTVYWEYKNR
jgi:hypothetical protein